MVLRSLIRTFVGMKYFLIAGEASGDLHARHLMDAIRNNDAGAEIRYWYRPDLAYMGFISVAMHLSEILRGMQECKKDILEFAPDRLILVDYPGFNLQLGLIRLLLKCRVGRHLLRLRWFITFHPRYGPGRKGA